jgi:hypothetical protein
MEDQEQPIVEENKWEGLQPEDLEVIRETEVKVEKKRQQRRRTPRKIKTQQDLELAQELLAEESQKENDDREKAAIYAKIKSYYTEFPGIYADHPQIGTEYNAMSLDDLKIELETVQTKANQMQSSVFMRTAIGMSANAVEGVGGMLPIVKLNGFAKNVEANMDSFEAVVKLIMLKHQVSTTAIEPEALLLGLVVKTVIATHMCNTMLERQSNRPQQEATIDKQKLEEFSDL